MVMQQTPPAELQQETFDRPIGRSIFLDSEFLTWEWQKDGILRTGAHEVADVWVYEDPVNRTGLQTHQVTVATRFGNEITWQHTISDDVSKRVINLDIKRSGEMSGWIANFKPDGDKLQVDYVHNLSKVKQIERFWNIIKGVIDSEPARTQRRLAQERTEIMAAEIEELMLQLLSAATIRDVVDKARLTQELKDKSQTFRLVAGLKMGGHLNRPRFVNLNPLKVSTPDDASSETKDLPTLAPITWRGTKI